MSSKDLPRNLRLLCSYAPSISAASRAMGLNRQQFHRYLSGGSVPSLRILRRICDYFGVEESEIFLDHQQFADLIAIKRPRPFLADPLGDYVAKLHTINPTSTKDLDRYLGFYHTYVMPVELEGKVLKSLVRMQQKGDFVVTKVIENYSSIAYRRQTLRYTGVAYHSGQQIFVHEREQSAGKMLWNTMLHPTESDQFAILSGLTMGVTSGNLRDIACYRTVWEFLGRDVNMRSALRACSVLAFDSPDLAVTIRAAIRNDISDGEQTFVWRPWKAT